MNKKNELVFLGLVGSLVFVMAFVLVPSYVEAVTFSPISGNATLTVGSRGENVRALQQLMTSNSDMYPSGSQDGVFGPATKKGVIQFQLAYNLTADGVVGTRTRNKVNSVVADGKGIDISAPPIYNLSAIPSGRNVSISFSSNEPVKATVFYDTNLINWDSWDDSVMSLQTPAISGTRNSDDSFSTNKQFTLNNLNANSKYNYTVTATDQSGNISVVWPTTFTTGQ